MKYIIIILLIMSFQNVQGSMKKTEKRKPASTQIEKVPKSLFLIKKAKINSAVGEPQFYPSEAQLRTVIYDQSLYNIKKYE